MPTALPCAQTRAHGKPDLCRVPEDRAHGKLLAHDKNSLCRVPEKKNSRQNFYTQQFFLKKVDSALPIFFAIHIQCIVLLVKFWYIYRFLLLYLFI